MRRIQSSLSSPGNLEGSSHPGTDRAGGNPPGFRRSHKNGVPKGKSERNRKEQRNMRFHVNELAPTCHTSALPPHARLRQFLPHMHGGGLLANFSMNRIARNPDETELD